MFESKDKNIHHFQVFSYLNIQTLAVFFSLLILLYNTIYLPKLLEGKQLGFISHPDYWGLFGALNSLFWSSGTGQR